MNELFEDEAALYQEKETPDIAKVGMQNKLCPTMDARRRLEHLLEEKRLRVELEDFLD